MTRRDRLTIVFAIMTAATVSISSFGLGMMAQHHSDGPAPEATPEMRVVYDLEDDDTGIAWKDGMVNIVVIVDGVALCEIPPEGMHAALRRMCER